MLLWYPFCLYALLSSTSLQKSRLSPQGEAVLDEQERIVREAVAHAFVVQLGGKHGLDKGWGRCLAVRADTVAYLRSQLGNELALKSRAQNLEPMGLVAYIEVRLIDVLRPPNLSQRMFHWACGAHNL